MGAHRYGAGVRAVGAGRGARVLLLQAGGGALAVLQCARAAPEPRHEPAPAPSDLITLVRDGDSKYHTRLSLTYRSPNI